MKKLIVHLMMVLLFHTESGHALQLEHFEKVDNVHNHKEIELSIKKEKHHAIH